MSASGGLKQEAVLYEQVYDLECLFMHLAEKCGQAVSYSSANQDLIRYSYDYSPNTACSFHTSSDVGTVPCALGVCKRLCYLMSDVLCEPYNVEITPSHLPIEQEAGVRITHMGNEEFGCTSRHAAPYAESRTASVISSQASAFGKRGYDVNSKSRSRSEFEEEP
jgi:hypothetical protein